MYTPGKIIYFDPFYFKDTTASKPKYFLVLKVINNITILASLPSSIKHLPANLDLIHGCIEIPEGCINCYIFKANQIITKCGFSFPLDTFLYGHWLDEFDIHSLEDKYQLNEVEYKIVGELLDYELQNVINCFINSAVVKRKFKRLLSTN